MTYGRYCHRLDPVTLEPLASLELPRNRPYNSLVVLPSGHLVMKDIAGGEGIHRLADGVTGSELVVLEPGSLHLVASLELPEGSIARLSALGSDVYVVGDGHVHRVRFDADAGSLTLDEAWRPHYRLVDGQTYGWDIVLSGGYGWFLDNGEGSEEFGGCYHGKTKSSAPLHLVRVPLPTGAGGGAYPVDLVEVCGEVGGVVANPPAVDDERRIAVGYDSDHGVMTAWRFGAAGEGLEELWQRRQDHAGHLLRWPASGQLLSYDFDLDRGTDQVVVLDIETGEELRRFRHREPRAVRAVPGGRLERGCLCLHPHVGEPRVHRAVHDLTPPRRRLTRTRSEADARPPTRCPRSRRQLLRRTRAGPPLAARGHDLVLGDPPDGLVAELEAGGASVEAVAGVGNLADPSPRPSSSRRRSPGSVASTPRWRSRARSSPAAS